MTYRDRYEAAMRAMPATAKEIAERIHATQYSVDRWTAELRRIGWVHVGGWQPCTGSGSIRPVLFAGQGEDAPKPPPASEAQRRERERIRSRKRYARKVARARDSVAMFI